jgi:tetrahydrodipicolinate N-succinyltransferase
MVSSGIDYRQTFFEFPELTKLHGEPTSENLFTLRNELKANAQTVYSNLSDGVHGHIALVISDAQYALLTPVPFVRPVFPGQLIIPPGTTGPMATVMREEHQEAIRIFREVQGVEKALIQQIVQAIEAPFLSALRVRATNALGGTVYDILAYLQDVYGRVSPQMVDTREEEVRNLAYNPQQPVDFVFNAVEDFAEFAELGGQPLSQPQIISKAYVILTKTRRFSNAIIKWKNKPSDEKTWLAFKLHFRRAHQDFRETTDITLEESELARNNANLVQQVVNGMQEAMANDTAYTDNAAMILQMTTAATQASDTQQQLNAQIQQMQQAMNLLQAQVANQQPSGFSQQYHQQGQGYNGYQNQTQGYQGPPPSGNYQGRSSQGRGGGRGYQGRGYQGRGSQGRGYQGNGRGYQGQDNEARQRNTSKYCWTHGCTGHTGTECRTKAQGHQDTATFENKMGGNAFRCT